MKIFQNFLVGLSPELLPLVAEDVADVGQGLHVVSRTAEDDRRKFEAVDGQNVGAERRQDWSILPGLESRLQTSFFLHC